MNMHSQLLAVFDGYRAATELSASRVSTILFGSGARIDALREGRSDVGTRTWERAMQWFSDHWPEAADWPEGVERPMSAVESALLPNEAPSNQKSGEELEAADAAGRVAS